MSVPLIISPFDTLKNSVSFVRLTFYPTSSAMDEGRVYSSIGLAPPKMMIFLPVT